MVRTHMPATSAMTRLRHPTRGLPRDQQETTLHSLATYNMRIGDECDDQTDYHFDVLVVPYAAGDLVKQICK